MKGKTIYAIILFLFTLNPVFSQSKNQVVTGIGFYNLENLFDTMVDPDRNKILQKSFTPKGTKKWTSLRYKEKLENLSKAIAEMGVDVNADGMAILGVAEVENKLVLEDLVRTEQLKKRGYRIVHYDSPDKRGIDVGLIYNPTYFKVISSNIISLRSIDTTFYTRDQLLVSGLLNGEKVHVIVSHWPSRFGGKKKSNPKRDIAADLGKKIMDSIQTFDSKAKIIYMGDLNDNPTDVSLKNHLNSVGNKKEIKEDEMFNPWETLYKEGLGTLNYKDVWNLFDQILVSPALIDESYSGYKYYKAQIFSKPYLKRSVGKYKGYPHRSFAGNTYLSGYSDHLPVYLFLIKNK